MLPRRKSLNVLTFVRPLNSVAAGRMLDAQWQPGEYWHTDPLSDLLITLGGRNIVRKHSRPFDY